jgi:BMFP domain-containing protein YqiC
MLCPRLLIRASPLSAGWRYTTKKTITTIEGLAALIHETMASKEDIKEFRAEVKQKFEVVESRLDHIEHLLIEEQRRKIEHLETRMKKLEDALAI